MKTITLIGLPAILFSTVFISCKRDNVAEPPKKIVVTGSSEMEIVPDEIYTMFTLKEYIDVTKKKVKLENIRTDFLHICKSVGVPDSNISIATYTGNERWDYFWYRKRKSDPDFQNSISYLIKTDTPSKLDEIVANLNEKAIENFNIDRTSHSNIEQLRQEVKTKALTAGKAKAEYLARSIGEELGEALLIQEIENNNNLSYYSNSLTLGNNFSNEALKMEGNSPATPNFQKIKIRYEMKVEFKLK